MKKENGVIIEFISPGDSQFGGMTTIENKLIFPKGYYEYLPDFEEQTSIYFQSNTCVAQSCNNAIETYFNFLIDKKLISEKNINWLRDNGYFKNGKINFNDRALAIASGTDPKIGNSLNKVYQTAKAEGLAPELSWPWDWRERDAKINNANNYFNDFLLPDGVKKLMGEFKKRFEISAEWVETKDWADAEKKGTIQVVANAWQINSTTKKYYNPAGKFNHACEGMSAEYLQIFDSIEPAIKDIEKIDDLYSWALKFNIQEIMPVISKPKIENNTLIFCAEGAGEFGLYLDERIITDDLPKILAMWVMRNAGKIEGKTKTLTLFQWGLFPKTNLKGNPL